MRKNIIFFLFLTTFCYGNYLPTLLYVNDQKAFPFLHQDTWQEACRFSASLAETESKNLRLAPDSYYHVIKKIDLSTGNVTLNDETEIGIDWWYTRITKAWQPGQCLKIYLKDDESQLELLNVEEMTTACGCFLRLSLQPEKIERIATRTADLNTAQIKLKSGWMFTQAIQTIDKWKVGDALFIFHDGKEEYFHLWNLTVKSLIKNWQVGTFDILTSEELARQEQQQKERNGLNIKKSLKETVIRLEEALNQRVVGQSEATQAVAGAMVSYVAEIKDPNTPIGVFLFLGPTGVGKTELAKVLAGELYHNHNHLIRLDMSQFVTEWTSSRLLGAPPGYVDSEKEGQLTGSLKQYPQSVILLDEIEKADPKVLKVFLPIFDEGYVNDAFNRTVSCTDAIFILTSNLLSHQIVSLFQQGYSSSSILETIEPELMKILTPELYNRVQPILFRPLTQEHMEALVDKMMKEVVTNLKDRKNIHLCVDKTVKDYLIQNGFHPTLGARPLKKLIQKEVVAAIAYVLVSQNIPNESSIDVSLQDNQWHVNWSPPLELGLQEMKFESK